jgi:glutaredoxin
MPEPRITVYSKPGCHLCDVAKEAVARISDETGAGWVDIDIIGDPDLENEYAEMIPVILLDGRMHGYFRVEEDRLRRDIAHGNQW